MSCLCNGAADDCPLCGGTGKLTCGVCGGLRWVMREYAKDKWQAVACQRCRQIPRPTFGSGLLSQMEGWTFAGLIEHPALREAAEWLKTVVHRRKGWVAFCSAPGRGKSYLLAATVNLALESGLTARYALCSTLLQELQDAQMGYGGYTYHALMRKLVGVQVLCLDEFGEYSPTAARDAALRELLVHRSDPAWLPTVLATNLTGNEVTRRFEWLVSRFDHPEVREFFLESVPHLREVRL